MNVSTLTFVCSHTLCASFHTVCIKPNAVAYKQQTHCSSSQRLTLRYATTAEFRISTLKRNAISPANEIHDVTGGEARKVAFAFAFTFRAVLKVSFVTPRVAPTVRYHEQRQHVSDVVHIHVHAEGASETFILFDDTGCVVRCVRGQTRARSVASNDAVCIQCESGLTHDASRVKLVTMVSDPPDPHHHAPCRSPVSQCGFVDTRSPSTACQSGSWLHCCNLTESQQTSTRTSGGGSASSFMEHLFHAAQSMTLPS